MKYIWIPITLLFAVYLVILNPTLSPTGAISSVQTEETYAYTLNDVVTQFFQVNAIIFPDKDCGELAQGFYENIAYVPTDETAGFDAGGKNRATTLNFVLDRVRRIGTIDLIKGSGLTQEGFDSFISINSEATVRIPKDTRNTFFNMDLYGTSKGIFIVNKGKFSIPSMDCTFENKHGIANCECVTHSIRDIAVAGIPAAVTVVRPAGEKWQTPIPQ